MFYFHVCRTEEPTVFEMLVARGVDFVSKPDPVDARKVFVGVPAERENEIRKALRPWVR